MMDLSGIQGRVRADYIAIWWALKLDGDMEGGNATGALMRRLTKRGYNPPGRQAMHQRLRVMAERECIERVIAGSWTVAIRLTDTEPPGPNPFEEPERPEPSFAVDDEPAELVAVEPKPEPINATDRLLAIMRHAGDLLAQGVEDVDETMRERLAETLEENQRLRSKLAEAQDLARARGSEIEGLRKQNHQLETNLEKVIKGRPVDDRGFNALRNMASEKPRG
jgi:hypothetical protein